MLIKLFLVFSVIQCASKKTIEMKFPCEGFNGMYTLVEASKCRDCGECYVIFDPDNQGNIILPVKNLIVTCERIEP